VLFDGYCKCLIILGRQGKQVDRGKPTEYFKRGTGGGIENLADPPPHTPDFSDGAGCSKSVLPYPHHGLFLLRFNSYLFLAYS
jgi:hypothetical protein